MKVSIITTHFDSVEIARRQVLHYNQMNLADDVEVIFVDDGTEPPLDLSDIKVNFNFHLYHTYDKRPWTQPAAQNYGAKLAKGEYLICFDMDHIVTMEGIQRAREPDADVIRFKRYAAVLLEDGTFTQDHDELRRWGLKEKYIKNRHLRLSAHGQSYIIQRQLFLDLGGVDTRYVGTGRYPNRQEVLLKRKLKQLYQKGLVDIIDDERRPAIYMFPNGHFCGAKDYNPFGYFHKLSRATNWGRKTNKQKRLTNKQKRAQQRGQGPERNNSGC